MGENMKFIVILLGLGLVLSAEAKEQDLLIHGCKMGVALTQAYLDKDSNLEMTRMHLRCVGGISRRPNIREEFNKEKTIENKKAYACGLGVGVALGFYDKAKLFSSKAQDIETVVRKCVKGL